MECSHMKINRHDHCLDMAIESKSIIQYDAKKFHLTWKWYLNTGDVDGVNWIQHICQLLWVPKMIASVLSGFNASQFTPSHAWSSTRYFSGRVHRIACHLHTAVVKFCADLQLMIMVIRLVKKALARALTPGVRQCYRQAHLKSTVSTHPGKSWKSLKKSWNTISIMESLH